MVQHGHNNLLSNSMAMANSSTANRVAHLHHSKTSPPQWSIPPPRLQQNFTPSTPQQNYFPPDPSQQQYGPPPQNFSMRPPSQLNMVGMYTNYSLPPAPAQWNPSPPRPIDTLYTAKTTRYITAHGKQHITAARSLFRIMYLDFRRR